MIDILGEVQKMIPHIIKFPESKMWIDYDRDAIVGITVLEASKRK